MIVSDYYTINFQDENGNIESILSHLMPYKKNDEITIIVNCICTLYKIKNIFHELKIKNYNAIMIIYIELIKIKAWEVKE